jgi:predicted house-cleaning NTP pyrophosphatase (Maf/HAM1 superfamily)
LQLHGRTREVVTGICLLHLRKHRQAVFAESTAVTFHPLDNMQIRRCLSRVNPLDKAGASRLDIVDRSTRRVDRG